MVWTVLGVIGGLLVGASGLFMLRWRRTRGAIVDEEERNASERGILGTLFERVSVHSRYVIGFCLIVLGYHLVSYSLPAGTLWLRVPPERLWILGIVVSVAVAGSLATDRFENR